MDATYPQHATADRLFYDKPHHNDTTVDLFTPANEAWETWTQSADATWSFWMPPRMALPEQGWKLHVSATAATADVVLETVSRYCHHHHLPYKFLRSRTILAATLAKDGDRLVSGKFITVYPTSPADLRKHLTDLDGALAGLPGPYVLTDLRWNQGPVFVRYGAFTPQFVSDNGVNVPAVRDLDTGVLVPDIRATSFFVPPWVTIPDFLQAELDRLGTTAPPGFPQVRGALQFSNAGGVYEAELDGRPVILKEARPHVGWTPDGRNAVQRLHDEAARLSALQGCVPVPAPVAVFTVHDHAYLAMEQIEATSLSAAVVARNPLSTSQPSPAVRRAYRDWATTVAASLRHAVTALHDAGWVHGDLHPGNVLVREDDTVVLIDLEMSRPVDDEHSAVIGAPGFVATDGRSGVEQDLYALACIELFMFIPLIPLLTLDPAKAGELVDAAATEFQLEESWASRQFATLAGRDRAANVVPTMQTLPDVTVGIARTLLADATPDRQDRLWPGDPAQFNEPPTGLAHGALGVLTVLQDAGLLPAQRHLAWVHAAEERSLASTMRLGLFDGLAGAVWAYRRMGLDEVADRRLAQLHAAHAMNLGYDLYGGLPGVGLTFLAESNRQPRLRQLALNIAASVRERWHGSEPPTRVATGGGGVLHGASGSALFALRLFEVTGDPTHLRIATEAIDYDLHSLRAAPDGSLHTDEGWRLLPYLGNGSAGIGIVLAQLLAHLPGHSRYLEALDGIARAATAPFTVQSGLFQGRAGLIQFLLALQRTGHATPATSAALRHHVAALKLHAVHRGDEVRFVGNGMLRASCDLATGTAGVLATLRDYAADVAGRQRDSASFPFLTPVDGVEAYSPLAAAGPRRGGEMNGVSPVTAVA